MHDKPSNESSASRLAEHADRQYPFLQSLIVLCENARLILLTPVLVGLIAFGIASLLPPVYSAQASILPLQQRNGGAAALGSLGPLSAFAGLVDAGKLSEQYVSLMQSTTILDRLVQQFSLKEVYGTSYEVDARERLKASSKIYMGRKDPLLYIQVEDRDPKRAADIANAYVEQLRKVVLELALTDVQQRRVFFERQLKETSERLADAQRALQAVPGPKRAEKDASLVDADWFAKLRAEVSAAEVRLQSLRGQVSEFSPEYMQAKQVLSVLKAQLAKEGALHPESRENVSINHYREFKYQEALFELFAKQYELARIDESRDANFIQVVDVALPPERKAKPQRLIIALGATVIAFFVLVTAVLVRQALLALKADTLGSAKLQELKGAWTRRNAGQK